MGCCCALIQAEVEATLGVISVPPDTSGRECHWGMRLPEMVLGVDRACIEFWEADAPNGEGRVWSWDIAVFTTPGTPHRSVDDPRLRGVARDVAERVLEKLRSRSGSG